ncbi:MAG: ATP-dependent DNA helicase RecQ [Saprospiraceae bacterium]|nr:ATP-dependent DNA helicase RecQ [Saprospiraceae bacterium]
MPQPQDILRQYWGYSSFRPLQEEIIHAVLGGHDTLALLPTGGGKSLCYQVPALCRDGICIVVSPLIALMKDQVLNLRKRGIAAAAVYSGMSRREVDIVLENACHGAYKLLYLSPERLLTDIAQERIRRMNVNLLAVDEAHCVSQWGYDFRPPYLRIAELRQLLPAVPLMALTATATPEVVIDIQEKLGFRQAKVFRQSFQRSNLSYSVLYESHKHAKLLDVLKRVPGSGIVYVRSRGETREIADFLRKNGISADFYHAGLSHQERNARQEAWIDNNIRVIVCTNAFGMGIDKPDVRTVVHLQMPDSLEAYFQEAGRGGRDGQKSYAVLFYVPSDAQTLRAHVQSAYPEMELIRRVYQALGNFSQIAVGGGAGECFDFDLSLFCANYKLDHAPTHAALRLLEQEGWIALSDAAALPSRLLISASREALYDYQLRHPQADVVIKVLLRAYPGVHHDFVDISEATLAKYAKMTSDALIQTLQHAEKEGIIKYEPRRESPQLIFLRERVAAGNLTIDQQKFQFRKSRAEERVEASVRYAETRRCRSQLLLDYFGENDSPACGICDVCTGRNKAEIDSETFDNLARKIREVLRHEPLGFEQILEAFAMKRHEAVAKTLSYMLDEQMLETTGDGKLKLPG